MGTAIQPAAFLLLAPVRKWPQSFARTLAHSRLFCDPKNPPVKLATYKYQEWLRHENSENQFPLGALDYENKPLENRVGQACTLLKSITKGRQKGFLNSILLIAVNMSNRLSENETLLIKLASGDMLKYYHIWLNDILINKGWLHFQSLLQLSLLVHDFKSKFIPEIGKTTTIPTASMLTSILEVRLEPLFLCHGKTLAEYWKPPFLYLLEYPNLKNKNGVLPAHFRTTHDQLSDSMLHLFIDDLVDRSPMNWVINFGRAMGLLD